MHFHCSLPIALAAVSVLTFTRPTSACDSCGCSLSNPDESTLAQGWRASIATQYSRFDKLQDTGREVSNLAGEHIDSTITHAVAGYNFSERAGVQLLVPYIDRQYRRVFDGSLQSGSVSGLGDITVQANYVAAVRRKRSSVFIGRLFGGVKLPTGDSHFLLQQVQALQGGPDSVVGGHDLALGSGSTDELLGASIYWRHNRWTAMGTAQQSFRHEGSFGYRYSDEFQWDFSPGYYLVFRRQSAAALSLDVCGENKGTDVFAGTVEVTDTGIHETYVGPKITATWRSVWSAAADLQFPVHESNTDLQLVPSVKAHVSVTRRF